jgi:SNF2 family DNA or RNA helicase
MRELQRRPGFREGAHKCVVFTQWDRFLVIIESALRSRGFLSAVFRGEGGDREAALERFCTRADTSVLLVLTSMTGGAAGLNLTMANTAFLMEPLACTSVSTTQPHTA